MYIVTEYKRDDKMPSVKILLVTDEVRTATKLMGDRISKNLLKYGYERGAVREMLRQLKKENKATATLKIGDNELGTVKLLGGKFTYYSDDLVGDILTLHSIADKTKTLEQQVSEQPVAQCV
jgi:hypothetical protein